MLNQEQQAATINIAMTLEQMGYPQLEMNYLFGKLHEETPEKRGDLLSFMYANTPKLFLEIMRQLPSVSNEPIISFKI